jgi:hypothetical protein
LRQVLESDVHRETIRTEERQVIRRTGQVETVKVVVPAIEREATTPLQRLQAKRRLPDLLLELAAAEEAVQLARAAEQTAARQRRAQAISEGEVEMRRLLPDLLKLCDQVRSAFGTYHDKLAALDQRVGEPYFTSMAACPVFGPDGMVAGWQAFVAGAYEVARR